MIRSATFPTFLSAAMLAGMLLYAGTLDYPYHYDDKHSVKFNPHIRSLGNVPMFFTDLGTFSSDPRGRMFRPVLLASYSVNYALHGQRVWGYRLVNILLLALCAALLCTTLHKSRAGFATAIVAGALFLVHPTHSELVNLISARSDLLVSTFALLAVGAAVTATAFAGRARMLTTYVLSLLAKSVAIAVPLVLLARDASTGGWRRVREQRFTHGALLSVSLGYVLLVYSLGFVSASLGKTPRGLGVHLLTQTKALVYYLWLFFCPLDLSVDHAFAVALTPWSLPFATSAVLCASLCWCVLRWRNHPLAWATGWFVITLLPASVVPLNILVSERRMFFPGAGLAAATAWCFGVWAQSRKTEAIAVAAVLCGVLALLTWQRNAVWSSEVKLWESAVANGPGVDGARVNLAVAYRGEGRHQDALRQLQTAVEINPKNAEAWAEIGNILYEDGRTELAEHALLTAREHGPWMEGVHYNLANLYQRQGRWPEAISGYAAALAIRPEYAEARNNLGQAYEGAGQLERAVAEYRHALEADPELAPAWFNLAAVLEQQGDRSEAHSAYSRAFALLSANPEVESNFRVSSGAQERASRGSTTRMGDSQPCVE